MLLAELLLLFVAADLSDYYGCFGRVEKADAICGLSRAGHGRVSYVALALAPHYATFFSECGCRLHLVGLPAPLLAGRI